MAYKDSVDKIILSYFTAVTEEVFTFKGKEYPPILLVVSPMLFRGYTCPSMCGACCAKYTLDYIPGEVRTGREVLRVIPFDGRQVLVHSDLQEDNDSYYCRNLNESGRCDIHTKHAFSCDFELVRFLHSDNEARLSSQLYGRGWNMPKVTGGRGAMCTMTEASEYSKQDVARKLRRLKQWTTHFGLTHTRLPAIIDWVESGPHESPLRFVPDGMKPLPMIPLPMRAV